MASTCLVLQKTMAVTERSQPLGGFVQKWPPKQLCFPYNGYEQRWMASTTVTMDNPRCLPATAGGSQFQGLLEGLELQIPWKEATCAGACAR